MSGPTLVGYCSHGVVGGCRRDDGPPCEKCRGKGFLELVDAGYYGNYPDAAECPNCKGAGVTRVTRRRHGR